jgi:dCMP deaminase
MSSKVTQEEWDRRFLAIAAETASWSKDRARKVGAVIVGPNKEIRSTGYNGFPRGIDDDVDERHERPLKYEWVEHSERNAVYNAARCGIPTEGCTMYTLWFPCTDCARAILQSGITKLVTSKPELDHPRWGEKFKIVVQMFEEAKQAGTFEVRYV